MESFNTLVLSLPTRNSTLRMRVWRALKESGCGVLRDGVYVLPANSPTSAALGKIESDIRSHGGVAMRVELHLKSDEQQVRLPGLFDRGRDYEALLGQIKET